MTDVASGQDCLSDRNENKIQNIELTDSSEISIKLNICNYFLPDKFIHIFKHKDKEWSYYSGFFTYNGNELVPVYKDFPNTTIDWKEFETVLDSFLIARIPTQKEIDLYIVTNNDTLRTNQTTTDSFFSSIMEGVEYSIDLYANKQLSNYSYSNPESYLQKLLKLGMNTREHEIFLRFTKYIINNFNFNNLQKLQIEEIDKLKKK